MRVSIYYFSSYFILLPDSLYLMFCLSIFFVLLFGCVSVCLFVWVYFCLCVLLSVCSFVCLSVCLFVRLSFCLCALLSVCSFVCLSVCLLQIFLNRRVGLPVRYLSMKRHSNQRNFKILFLLFVFYFVDYSSMHFHFDGKSVNSSWQTFASLTIQASSCTYQSMNCWMTRQILMLLNFLQYLRKMSTWWFLFLLRIKYESQLCFKANIKMREAAQSIKRKEMYQMQWNWKNSTQVEQWMQEMVYLHF